MIKVRVKSRSPFLSTMSRRWITAAIWVYFTLLLTWVALYAATGDRIGFVSLVNNLAVYFFLPIPFVVLLGVFIRRLEIWLCCALGTLVFIWLWGPLMVPRFSAMDREPDGLAVMTYNVLGRHHQYRPVIDTIRSEAPDVVLLQELNPVVAGALQQEMRDDYPYQILDPVEGVTGMGVISKFPLTATDVQLPLEWVGTPLVLEMEWQGLRINLVNFHMFPTGLGTPAQVDYVNRLREDQARALLSFARQAPPETPLIIAGDANVTSLADAYKIVTTELNDAWWVSGFGLGHTFPGSAVPGSARPRLAGWPVPQWLARIDYIFYSSDWSAVDARLASFDGVSDHRAVVAILALE